MYLAAGNNVWYLGMFGVGKWCGPSWYEAVDVADVCVVVVGVVGGLVELWLWCDSMVRVCMYSGAIW